MIEGLDELQVVLTLDVPPGTTVATWRDEYAATSASTYRAHVDLCLEYLQARGECWDCGTPTAAVRAPSPTSARPPACSAHPPTS